MASLKRTLSRRIFVAGVEKLINGPQDTVDICKALLADIDASNEREAEYRAFHEKEVICTEAAHVVVVPKRVVNTADEKESSDDTPGVNDTMSNSKRRRLRSKAAEDRVKQGATVIPSGVPAVAAPTPTATSRNPAPLAVGTGATKHICVSYLAESSGVCTGVTCTYGSTCSFRHVAVSGTNKREALNAIDRGWTKKMTPDQATALRAYVEVNCT